MHQILVPYPLNIAKHDLTDLAQSMKQPLLK